MEEDESSVVAKSQRDRRRVEVLEEALDGCGGVVRAEDALESRASQGGPALGRDARARNAERAVMALRAARALERVAAERMLVFTVALAGEGEDERRRPWAWPLGSRPWRRCGTPIVVGRSLQCG